ncbi:hypothetical protein [Paenibacillus sp. FSL L8-0709]|uniref:hypothetical protein n=1 Tax=Paenibacillus sp. FSL L8-0709 TaxID=2975312 RepID=UPI0030F52505
MKSYYVSEEGYYSDDVYVGGWKNDKEDGKGVKTTESGSITDGVAVVTSHYYSVRNSKDGETIESYSRHEEETNFNFVEYSNQKTGLYISISFEGNGKGIYKKTEFMNLFNDYKNLQQIIYHIDKSEDKSEKMLKDKRIELYFEQESGGYYKNNIAYKDGTYREVQKEVYIDWENKPNVWSYTYSLQTDLKNLSNSKTVALSIKPFMEEYKEVLPLLKPYLEGFKNLGH